MEVIVTFGGCFEKMGEVTQHRVMVQATKLHTVCAGLPRTPRQNLLVGFLGWASPCICISNQTCRQDLQVPLPVNGNLEVPTPVRESYFNPILPPGVPKNNNCSMGRTCSASL